MIEIELAEIEQRMSAYPPDAQADIRWLTRELRKLYNLGTRLAEPPASAIYDPITGVMSGGAYGVRFAAARARAGRNKKLFAVVSIHLQLSAGTAEALEGRDLEDALKQIAERLMGCAREADTLARVDHEKFAMILEDLAFPEHAERVKQNVESALAGPVLLATRAVRVAASVSLQLYPTVTPVDREFRGQTPKPH